MKAKRIINGVFWAILAVSLSVIVCLEWHKNGCDWKALLLATLFYAVISAGFAYIVDKTIKEHYNL